MLDFLRPVPGAICGSETAKWTRAGYCLWATGPARPARSPRYLMTCKRRVSSVHRA